MPCNVPLMTNSKVRSPSVTERLRRKPTTPSWVTKNRTRRHIMLEQCEGSHAVAKAVALSRPEVICAYPISPQTHSVEGLGEMVKSGELTPCEFVNVESEC